MSKIIYIKGDATQPIVKPACIVHICNDIGAWGAGFVLAISKRWKQPEMSYKNWSKNYYELPFKLGNVQFVQVEKDITITNMIAQHGVGIKNNQIPLRYNAVYKCLKKVYETVNVETTIHMPRIGCGLAGGEWSKIEKIIQKTITRDTYVYDL